MKTIATALALAMALGVGAFLQWPSQMNGRASGQAAGPAPSVQQLPIMPVDTTRRAVQITQGPVVEHVTDTTVEIAWSTNVNSGTSLRYGTDPGHLDQTASMPWGGLTHRVLIKNLQPNTTYYFKAESGEGQGTGTQAETGQSSFQTKPAGSISQIP
jgi:Purple acid Phosphatase, N-terminal domain